MKSYKIILAMLLIHLFMDQSTGDEATCDARFSTRRVDCGAGLGQKGCESIGCCWDVSQAGAKFCFRKNQCFPDGPRSNCDEDNQSDCESSGCCWDDTTAGRPFCFHKSVILCPEVSVDNGMVACTNYRYYKSECLFTCDDGYTRWGDEKKVCQNYQQWSPRFNFPVCKKFSPKCPDVDDAGICVEQCEVGGCDDEKICCPTACGGTTCVKPESTPSRFRNFLRTYLLLNLLQGFSLSMTRPPTQGCRRCEYNPCAADLCPGNLQAQCRSCGCDARYMEPTGIRFQCSCRPGEGIPVYGCSRELCDRVVCLDPPTSICRVSSCGGCKRVFYSRTSRTRVNCRQVSGQ